MRKLTPGDLLKGIWAWDFLSHACHEPHKDLLYQKGCAGSENRSIDCEARRKAKRVRTEGVELR